jgi:hypothetical protein
MREKINPKFSFRDFGTTLIARITFLSWRFLQYAITSRTQSLTFEIAVDASIDAPFHWSMAVGEGRRQGDWRSC